MKLKNKNTEKKDLIPIEEGKFIGNMIFHVGSEAFDAANKMETFQDLSIYQGMLKWNFANMIDKEVINLSLAFADMVEATGKHKSNNMFGNVNINPYEVLEHVKFLRQVDWWMGSFNHLQRDEHGYILDHPFIDMTAANIFGELTNRVFANIGCYYTDIDVAEAVQFVIHENYDDMIRMIKNLFQMALDYIMIWGQAMDIVEAKYPEERSDTCKECESNCSCGANCHCHDED